MKNDLLVSMASFDDYGGWCLDTQFVVNMGVPYLLAHGLGKPVEDAKTKIEFPSVGEYHVYVYTYNWVAPWTKKYAPGEFMISLNGVDLKTSFGNQGDSWGWTYGGTVNISQEKRILSLRDLTGFEGRCGLIYFSKERADSLPVSASEITEFYKNKMNVEEDKKENEYDLAVCGGGIAGICTALSAARNGVKTVLIQDRPVVGGNNSSEVRVWLGGETNFEPFPSIGNIVNELEQSKVGHYGSDNKGENYEDDKKLELLLREENLTVLLNHIITDVKMNGDTIENLSVWDIKSDSYTTIKAKLYSDSTGDSTVGFLAGADFEVTTNGHMGMTNSWYVEQINREQDFPKCPWAIDLAGVDFPGKVGVKDVYGNELDHSLGCWFWESGCELDPIEKAEYARDVNFRAMYGAWDAIKNVDGDYQNYSLAYSSYIGGKRESRRLFGDVILTKNEVKKGVKYPDGCIPSTWNFDVHYPDRRFYEAFRAGDSFITKDYHEPFEKPFFIPYRCLYSRNVRNLFMSGRNVSVSHDALGTVRVMRTGGMMGEVIGYAAKLCKKYDALPRDVYEKYLGEFMEMLKTIPKTQLNDLVANVNADGQ